MIKTDNASRMLNKAEHAMVESEGRWPRICALTRWTGQQSEVCHVF